MKHILVTGGAGFIGSAYVDHLLDATGHRVTVVDSLTYAGDRDRLPTDHDRLTFHKLDITATTGLRTPTGLADHVAAADEVVHLAASSHVDRSISDARRFADTNVAGTAELLDLAIRADIDRFLYVSTDEVYGEAPPGVAYAEGDPLAPENPYAATKAGADHLVQAFQQTHGLDTVTVRPTNCFGPRQHPEKFIPKAITAALADDAIPLYGDGTQVREWLYVTDAAAAIETARREGLAGYAYNAGSGDRRENRAVAEAVIDAVGGGHVEHVEDRPGHDERYAVATERLRSLGWKPTVGFAEGLERAVAYYRERAAVAPKED